MNADHPYRDSFAYDVMEPVRPYVDNWLIEFIKNHVFSKTDFYETGDGGVRLTLKTTLYLPETILLWANKIEPVIKHIKILFLE